MCLKNQKGHKLFTYGPFKVFFTDAGQPWRERCWLHQRHQAKRRFIVTNNEPMKTYCRIGAKRSSVRTGATGIELRTRTSRFATEFDWQARYDGNRTELRRRLDVIFPSLRDELTSETLWVRLKRFFAPAVELPGKPTGRRVKIIAEETWFGEKKPIT